MYQIGDLLVYKTDGVYQVENIGTPNSPYIDKTKDYYFLRPLSKNGTTYVPVDAKIYMRPVMSRETAHMLIEQIPLIQEEACGEMRTAELADHYRGYLESHSCTDLVQLIKTVYRKKKVVASQGRKLGKIDREAMLRAEELLYDELAVALQIPKEEVRDYMKARIERREPQEPGTAAGRVEQA